MQINRHLFHIYILDDEGGYVERSNEPGGGCNHGITLQLLTEVWAKEGRNIAPTLDDLKALTPEQANDVYDKHILDPLEFDLFPSGLDYVMANTAVMQGVHGAVKLLQAALHQPETGVTSVTDWDKIRNWNVRRMAAGVLIRQAALKMKDIRVGPHLDDHGKETRGFGPGWGDRLVRIEDRIEDMFD